MTIELERTRTDHRSTSPAGTSIHSILRGVVIPPYGGSTVWANIETAYDLLSAPHHEGPPYVTGPGGS